MSQEQSRAGGHQKGFAEQSTTAQHPRTHMCLHRRKGLAFCRMRTNHWAIQPGQSCELPVGLRPALWPGPLSAIKALTHQKNKTTVIPENKIRQRQKRLRHQCNGLYLINAFLAFSWAIAHFGLKAMFGKTGCKAYQVTKH